MYRVLLVEDDRMTLLLYKGMKVWNETGFIVTGEARNGKEALDELEKNKYDIVMVDVIMPIMNGLELLKEIQNRKIPVTSIIASTYSEFNYVRTSMHLGAVDYLLKPVGHEKLTDCLTMVKTQLEEKCDTVERIFRICGANVELNFVQKVMQYFRENLETSLADIAEEFQLSKDYVGKLFKEQMGENFNSFVYKYKMEYAKIMLQGYEYKIYEISEKLGYKSTDYFSRLFKKYEGITPIQYRRAVRENVVE